MKIEFQGKNLQPIKNMIYWFKWGRTEFDIRDIRAVYNRKQEKKIDLNFEMHECTRFQKMMNEIIEMVGETDFKKIIDSSYKLQEGERFDPNSDFIDDDPNKLTF